MTLLPTYWSSLELRRPGIANTNLFECAERVHQLQSQDLSDIRMIFVAKRSAAPRSLAPTFGTALCTRPLQGCREPGDGMKGSK